MSTERDLKKYIIIYLFEDKEPQRICLSQMCDAVMKVKQESVSDSGSGGNRISPASV